MLDVLFRIIVAFACYTLAKEKRRGEIFWGILGVFFPVFSLVILAFLPRERR